MDAATAKLPAATTDRSIATTSRTRHQQQQQRRSVSFGTVSQVVYDASLTMEEYDLCFHNPDELKKWTRSEIQLARRCFRATGNHHHTNKPPAAKDFCFRGLEKRLQSATIQKRKWYTFLQSFLALQHDLKKLEGDVSNLLAVFVSTHSKCDQVTAYQMAKQDEITAFAIYNLDNQSKKESSLSNNQTRRLHLRSASGSSSNSSSRSSRSSGDHSNASSASSVSSKLKPSNSKSNLRNGPKRGSGGGGCHLARIA